MSESERTRLDSLLDLLVDEVAGRLAARREAGFEPPAPPEPAVEPAAVDWPPEWPFRAEDTYLAASAEPEPDPAPPAEAPITGDEPFTVADAEEEATAEAQAACAPGPAAEPSRTTSLLLRLVLGILAIVAVVNVPLNAEGTALARSIPSSTSLVIRDGLVVKEASSPEFWVYRDEEFHWITSLDAFERYGYRWSDVHVVDDGFLRRYAKGQPLYLLLKCGSSPHVYRIEEERKRWIVDLVTFHAEGHRWEDVRYVDCTYLRHLPDGETIPPGRGTPPPPRP